MSLRAKVVRGVSWNLASRVGTQIFQLAFGIALARLLSPREFGLIGMLIIFTGFAQVLADSGLSSALIYQKNATELHFSTVFWIQIVIGAALSSSFYFGAPLVSAFYALPMLEPLTRMVSSVFVIQALGQTQYSLLTKEFRFHKLAIANIGSTVLSGALAVWLALHGYGVWALAWQVVSAASVMTVLYWIQSEWSPRLVFDRMAAIELGSYAIYLMGHGSLNYWLRNGDNLLIGKVLGASQLGIYSRAYALMLLPMNNIGAVLGQVMFPALTQLQEDIPRFRDSYMSIVRLIALVTFPMMIGLMILSRPLTMLLFGPKWAAVVPVLEVLSLVGLFQSVIFPVGWVFTALGRTKAQFHLSIVLAVAFVIMIGAGVHFGIIAVAYAYVVWTLLAGFLNLRLAGDLIGVTVSAFAAGVRGIFITASLMGIVVFASEAALPATAADFERLAVGVSVGIVTYSALCVLFRVAAFAEAWQLVSSRASFGSGR